MSDLSRRALIGSAAAGAAGLLARPFAGPARAAAPMAGTQAPGFYRLRLGTYELTALYDGAWDSPVDAKTIRNARLADVQRALTDAFLPRDKLPFSYTALLVNTGSKLVLLDAGTGGQIGSRTGAMPAHLAAAGISPEAIDAIAISHFHADHISGLKTKDNALVFPNAEVLVPEPEWRFFMDEARLATASNALRTTFLNVRRIFSDMGERVRPFAPGRELAPGIASIAAFGHTPGHCAFSVASGRQSMLAIGDTAHHPALFLRHPHWQAAIDMDGPLAAEVRIRMLDRAAADRMLVQGYHFPFPAAGHVVRTATGYDFAPAMWQPL
jgi:glyoxylase-like metal-dependent hydrolase (beta-lactamase superfamily II)